MKNLLITVLLLSNTLLVHAQWQPAGDRIKTQWGENMDVNNVWSEYPRPIMVRPEWKNLNGLWDYAIKPKGEPKPASYDGKILVPFAVESSLSGVQKIVGTDHELWYQTDFSVPAIWKGKDVLLHFGAVDWQAEIWINNIAVGSHRGGYAPFSFDITPFLKAGNQTITVRVWDPSDDGPQPRGKQVKEPRGIWYTPVTGIWQTVWLEPVSKKFIANIRTTPDIDKKRVDILANPKGAVYGDLIEVVVREKGKVIAGERAVVGQPVSITLPDAKLWSPASPFLYDMEVSLISGGKVTDKVASYFAMRKISSKRDEHGIVRLQLNNEDNFQFGPLDQGWWPDGLYTAPSDEALKYDIRKTKDFGFNMIRKHVKVEPARWYTHCDRMGMLVWQDMPSGDLKGGWQRREYFKGNEHDRSPESEKIFRDEWKEIMDYLQPYPSIVCWVPFNEAWGQFKTKEIVEWTQGYDPTRIVNPASGGNHFPVGDMLDLHNYPDPELYLYDAERATVLGEYGGIGLPLKDHLWEPDRNWGYVQFKSSEEVTDQYVKYAEMLEKMAKSAFSAAVYTQTTDVEIEVNGLMSYDRKVIKLDEKRMKEANEKVIGAIQK